MGDTTVHNESLELQLKKLRKVSLDDSKQLNMSGNSVRKKSESDNESLKSPINCKHSFEDAKKQMSGTKNNNNNNESKQSKVSLVLDNSIESDEELTESSELLDVSLCIEEPDDLSISSTDTQSRDYNGVQVTVNNNRGSTSSEEASSPAKAKKNCKLHKSESFGPIKLRKTGGEILLSRYHKVGIDISVIGNLIQISIFYRVIREFGDPTIKWMSVF